MRKMTTALLTVALSAGSAMAWTSWGTKDGDKKMDLSANPGGLNGNTAVYQTYIRSGTEWNRPSCSAFTFRKAANAIQNRSVPVRDGYNHIVFGNADGALAVTWLMNNSSNRECDVIIDDRFNWNIGPDPSKWNEYDLEGVSTHEFGHVLGLGHSSISAATMYYAIGAGDDSKRTLHSDDENGVCTLY